MPPVIAIILDFDDTLAPDSTTGFLASLGIDTEDFWKRQVGALLTDGWDPIPAYLYSLLEYSRRQPPGHRITRARLAAWGRDLKLHHGAVRMFGQLRAEAARLGTGHELEFYLLSSGLREIIAHTRIVREFRDLWACDFHYNQDDEIDFPRNVISFTDKTRYLFQIAKGQVGPEYRNRPFAVNDKVPALRVPFDHMIVVGDGYTDIPCFSLVQRFGGVAVGLYDPDQLGQRGRAWSFVTGRRVSSLYRADFGARSDLMGFLRTALEQIATRPPAGPARPA